MDHCCSFYGNLSRRPPWLVALRHDKMHYVRAKIGTWIFTYLRTNVADDGTFCTDGRLVTGLTEENITLQFTPLDQCRLALEDKSVQ